jgi:DNA-binding response OmpR family regulator/Tfp pilus assembly protein PilF
MEATYHQFNCLIIDDFEQMRVSLRGMLSSFGAKNITICSTGEEGLRHLSSTTYDVVICDYNLGEGRDGQQVLEEARYQGYLKHASIFFMVTAESSMPLVLGALEQQPDEYMVKPLNQEALHHRLEIAIQRKLELGPIDHALAENDIEGAIKYCGENRGSDLKQSLYLAKLQAELHQEINQYSKAQAIYSELLAIRDFHWARFGLGKVAYYLGDYAKAEAAFQDLVEKNRHFLVAYEWLARILERRGDLLEAQKALSHALKLSPKSVARQRRLGMLALQNGDHETARRALQAAVRWGANSCFATAEEYRCLADLYQEHGEKTKMVRLLADGCMRFNHRPADKIQMLCAQALVKHSMNQSDEVEAYLSKVHRLVTENKQDVSPDHLLLVAKDCYQLSLGEAAKQYLELIVCNKHDDEVWIELIRQLMSDHDQGEESQALIESAQNKIAQVHSQSLQLLRQGKRQQAIDRLNEIIEQFPYNKTMVLLGAKAMILDMHDKGVDNRYHFACRYSLAVLCSQKKQDPEVIKFLVELDRLQS